LAATAALPAAGDSAALRERVLALARPTVPPATRTAEGFAGEGDGRAIFFDSVPWQGESTRVFAWLGLPPKRDGKVRGHRSAFRS